MRKLIGITLMVVFVAAYAMAMIYSNYVYGHSAAVMVFVGAMCAFGFFGAYDSFVCNYESKHDEMEDNNGTD